MFNANTGAVTTHCAKCSAELCVALTATERASGELGRRFCLDGCKRSSRKAAMNEPEQVERVRMRVTEEIKAKVLEMRGDGRSIREIKEEVGISPPTILRILKESSSEPKSETSVSEPKTGIFRPPPLPPVDDKALPAPVISTRNGDSVYALQPESITEQRAGDRQVARMQAILDSVRSSIDDYELKIRGCLAIESLLVRATKSFDDIKPRQIVINLADHIAREAGIKL